MLIIPKTCLERFQQYTKQLYEIDKETMIMGKSKNLKIKNELDNKTKKTKGSHMGIEPDHHA